MNHEKELSQSADSNREPPSSSTPGGGLTGMAEWKLFGAWDEAPLKAPRLDVPLWPQNDAPTTSEPEPEPEFELDSEEEEEEEEEEESSDEEEDHYEPSDEEVEEEGEVVHEAEEAVPEFEEAAKVEEVKEPDVVEKGFHAASADDPYAILDPKYRNAVIGSKEAVIAKKKAEAEAKRKAALEAALADEHAVAAGDKVDIDFSTALEKYWTNYNVDTFQVEEVSFFSVEHLKHLERVVYCTALHFFRIVTCEKYWLFPPSKNRATLRNSKRQRSWNLSS